MIKIVEVVIVGGFDWWMFDFECGDFEVVFVVDDVFFDCVCCYWFDGCWQEFFVVMCCLVGVVKGVGFVEVGDYVVDVFGFDDFEWC